MTNQNRTQPQKSQPHDTDTDRQDHSTAPEEPDRFDKKEQDRSRSVVEQANQGQGPLNVGDQSRARN